MKFKIGDNFLYSIDNFYTIMKIIDDDTYLMKYKERISRVTIENIELDIKNGWTYISNKKTIFDQEIEKLLNEV